MSAQPRKGRQRRRPVPLPEGTRVRLRAPAAGVRLTSDLGTVVGPDEQDGDLGYYVIRLDAPAEYDHGGPTTETLREIVELADNVDVVAAPQSAATAEPSLSPDHARALRGAQEAIRRMSYPGGVLDALPKAQVPSMAEYAFPRVVGPSVADLMLSISGRTVLIEAKTFSDAVALSPASAAAIHSLSEQLRRMSQPLSTMAGFELSSYSVLTGLADSFASVQSTVITDALKGMSQSVAAYLEVRPRLPPPITEQFESFTRGLFERRVQELFDMSGDEFIRRWEEGEIETDEAKPETAEIIVLATMIPIVKKAA